MGVSPAAVQAFFLAKHDAVVTHPGHGLAVSDPRSYHHALGLSVSNYALVLGIASGLSLPLGAVLGVKMSPVDDTVCAAMMAFGAGALLFAVTVELYGHSLRELESGHMGMLQLIVTITFALVGALFYLFTNRQLEMMFNEEAPPSHEPLSALPPQPQPFAALCSLPAPGGRSSTSPRGRAYSSPRGYGATSVAAPTSPLLRSLSANDAPCGEAPRSNDSLGTLATHSTSMKEALAQQGFHAKGRAKSLMRLLNNEEAVVEERKLSVREAPSDLDEAERQAIQKARSTASALFLGLLIDGIPEGILMGFLAAEGHLTPALVVSLFIANFPEAFSSASLLVVGKMPVGAIIGMWTLLCIVVGCLTGLSCKLLLAAYPTYADGAELPLNMMLLIAMVEGITGGAMMACISSVMLPEAFERSDNHGSLLMSSGFLCTCGFLMAVFLKASFG